MDMVNGETAAAARAKRLYEIAKNDAKSLQEEALRGDRSAWVQLQHAVRERDELYQKWIDLLKDTVLPCCSPFL